MRRSVKEHLRRLEGELWHSPSLYSRRVAKALLEPEGLDLLRAAFLRAENPYAVDLEPLLAYDARRRTDKNASRARSMDWLEIVPADYFTGVIRFDPDLGAYTPEYRTERFTRLRRVREKDMEDTRIARVWEDMHDHVKTQTPDGGLPLLLRGDHDKHLYFIRCENTELIKIGIARHPARRLKQIESDLQAAFRFNPDKAPALKLLHVVDCGGRELESLLHTAFAPYRLSYHGSQTEWFIPKALLRLYIHALILGADPYETLPQELVREANLTPEMLRPQMSLRLTG